MVFGGPLDQEQDRYSTWEDAEAGHAEMEKKVRAALSWFGRLWWLWRRVLLALHGWKP
jgi:hypothetical protein